MERQGGKGIRKTCERERGRLGFRGVALGGRGGNFGSFEHSLGELRLQWSSGCDSCGNSWPLIL